MDTDPNKQRIFFEKTRAKFGARMEDYARSKSKNKDHIDTNFNELENFRQKKRTIDDKRRFLFRITTVLFGLIFLYVFLRLASNDIMTFFY